MKSYLSVGLPGRTGKGEIPSVIDILEAGLLPNTPWAGEESVEEGVDDMFVSIRLTISFSWNNYMC